MSQFLPLSKGKYPTGGWGEMKRIFNIHNTIFLRKELRKNMSEEELIFWSAVKDEKIAIKFRRQYGIGRYIADFCIPKHKIAIEIDGSQHLNDIAYDKKRDEYFNIVGVKTLRFSTKEVRDNLSGVIGRILEEVKMR